MDKRIVVPLIALTSLLVTATACLAQNADAIGDSAKQPPAPVLFPERDMGDVMHTLFHKKEHTDSSRFKSKVYTSIFPAAGYSLQTGFAVLVGSSIAFYTDTLASHKISSILTTATYTQYNQFIFPVAASIFTKRNDFNILLDYRFLKYPSTTYGLGAKTTNSDAYTITYNNIKLHQTVLKKIYGELYAGIGIYYDHYWNIQEVTPPEGEKTSFQKYGNSATETAVGPALRLLYDTRTNQINPDRGSYTSIVYRPNYTFMGSDNNWQSLQIDFRKYIPLTKNGRNTLALWSFDWFTFGKPPYLTLPSTGWDDEYNTGRGYIQSRFRAREMIYAEAEYRFGISNNGLLGGVVFANAQSFSKDIASQLSVIAPAVGTGLRIKLNKSSKANLCIDYGFGLNGSKGLFLNLGEVF
jgi:outer membrane protein assembly factor BamA